METKVKNNSTVNKAGSSNGQRMNNLPVSTAFNDKEEPKKEEVNSESQKTEEAKPAGHAKQAEQPAQEPSKKELKEQFQQQQAKKLEETEKLVEQLGKKIAQKKKLQNTIANLDGFTLAQSDDKDDMASDSRFQRCELVITDDDGNEFVTKNPFIIAYVAHEVRQLCVDKLAEVESTIVIP